MKRIIMTLSVLVTIGLTAVTANESTNIDPRILSAFQKEFSFAKNVKWDTSGEFVTVRFSLNNQGLLAWYNRDGELMSVARNILYMQLPLSVIQTLEEKYKDAAIYGIVEVTKNNNTEYFMNADTKERKLLLRATTFGDVTVEKKLNGK